MQFSKKAGIALLIAVLSIALVTIIIQIKQASVITDNQLLQPKLITADHSLNKIKINEMIRSARLFYTFWNTAEPRYLNAAIAPNFFDNMVPKNSNLQGMKGMILSSNNLRKAIPDLHCTIEELLITGDKVTARLTYTGTLTGPLKNYQPTNKPINLVAIDILHFKDGKIIEGWHVEEVAPLLNQLSK